MQSARRLQRDEAVLEREPCQVGVVAQAEFLQHVAAVGVDCLDADAEEDRNLTVGETAGEEAEGLQLARAEHAHRAAAAQRGEPRAEDGFELHDHPFVISAFDLGVAFLFGEARQRYQYRRLYGPWPSVLHNSLLFLSPMW